MNARSRTLVSALVRARVVAAAGAVAAAMVVAVACGGSDKSSGVGDAKLPEGTRGGALEHEACDEGGRRVETLDANGDGKPDIRRVFDSKSGRESCRITDLNHDGKPDMFEYYDANGQLRRREADYDDSGVVDAVEYYENGRLVRRELDTTGQHRIDTWDFFDPGSGKRLRRERDTTGDGRVDQWWSWNGDQVTIAVDKNNDGKPDPDQAITIGANGQPVTQDAGMSAAQANIEAGAPPSPPTVTAQPQTGPELDAGPPPTPPGASGAADGGAADGGKAAKKSGGKK